MRYDDFDEYSRPMNAAARKKRNAAKAAQIEDSEPLTLKGRNIANTFWGKAWCAHVELFRAYASRLPQGRSYLHQGAVLDLKISDGLIQARVLGSELYTVSIAIAPLPRPKWEIIRNKCTGRISSLIDLLQGKLSSEIIAILCDPEDGLFPLHCEIDSSCDCQDDWADLCKHQVAVFYGVGSRLDKHPELLFLLRGVNQQELLKGDWAGELSAPATLETDNLGDMFGIELDSL